VFNKDFIACVLRVITVKNDKIGDHLMKNTTREIIGHLNSFFSEYKSLVNYENINISYLWQILEYEITDIYKNYKNNIELNFVNKINQFINRSLNVRETRLAINRITNINEKKLKLSEFNNRIKLIKDNVFGLSAAYTCDSRDIVLVNTYT